MNKLTLRDLRLQSGKTVAEVANALNVTEMSIYRYENGQRQIDIQQVLSLSTLYGVSAEDIILAQLNSHRRDQ